MQDETFVGISTPDSAEDEVSQTIEELVKAVDACTGVHDHAVERMSGPFWEAFAVT